MVELFKTGLISTKGFSMAWKAPLGLGSFNFVQFIPYHFCDSFNIFKNAL